MIDYETRPIRNEDERQACLAIREQVFVGEQNVPMDLERDAYDAGGATHFIALMDGVPLGTGRIRIADGEAKIQRVAVLSVARGTGAGVALMQAMEGFVREHALAENLTLGAQVHAKGFYAALGYRQHGGVFDDAGIDHVEMRKAL